MRFIGTTNRAAYLKDESGGCRFWRVKTGVVDIDGLVEDRDQLFAEAVVLYRNSEQWPEPAFEQTHIKPQQEARYEADAWTETIIDYLKGHSKVLIGQVAKEGLGIERARIGRADQNRIIAILELLGWQRQERDWKGYQWWAKK